MFYTFILIVCIIILIIAYPCYFVIWKYLSSKPIETLLDLLMKELIMTVTTLLAYNTLAQIIIPNLQKYQHEIAVGSGFTLTWIRTYVILSILIIILLKQIMIYKIGFLDEIPDNKIILMYRIKLIISSTILSILDYYPLNYETTEDYMILTGSKIPPGKYV